MIKHERLCPKVELEEKKWDERKWKKKVWKRWKEMEEEREFNLRNRMLQNESTVKIGNFNWDHERR